MCNAAKGRERDWALTATKKEGRKATECNKLPNTANSIITITILLVLSGQTKFTGV